MGLPAVFSWLALNTQAVCATQTLGGAGSLIINGTLANNAIPSSPSVTFARLSRVVSLTSANDLSAVTFTITGTYRTAAVSVTIAGPNANTVQTTQLFDSVTSVSADGAAAAVSVGSGSTGQTHWYLDNSNCAVANLGIQVAVTGTIAYSFVATLDDVNTVASPVTFKPITAMSSATTNQLAAFTTPVRYVCIKIESSSAAATLTATLLQQGIV